MYVCMYVQDDKLYASPLYRMVSFAFLQVIVENPIFIAHMHSEWIAFQLQSIWHYFKLLTATEAC